MSQLLRTLAISLALALLPSFVCAQGTDCGAMDQWMKMTEHQTEAITSEVLRHSRDRKVHYVNRDFHFQSGAQSFPPQRVCNGSAVRSTSAIGFGGIHHGVNVGRKVSLIAGAGSGVPR